MKTLLALTALLITVGCGGGTEEDAGTDVDSGGASCTGASDGTSCGTDRICLGESCVESRCGDGFIDPARGETCDDGNDVAFDGCEPTSCRATCSESSECDDGVACNGAETCSDSVCAVGVMEPDGTTCSITGGAAGVCRAGSCVVAGCGDGILAADESCDDGNDADGDGCESDCRFTCEVDPSAPQRWYVDCDGDGYASDGALTDDVCLPPAATGCGGGWTLLRPVGDDTDCDDDDPDSRPGGTEICDGADQDCDGTPDNGVLLTFYRDADTDGHGDATMTMEACAAPSGFVTSSDDCDDDCITCLPGGTETCDTRDNNCNMMIDEGVLTTFYRDSDEDGFGNSAMTMEACTAPSGYTDRDGDCDDGDVGAFPGQTAYFTRARMGGGFDFDCDSRDTRQFNSTGPATCRCTCPVGFCCAGMCSGWTGAVPRCGDSAEWRETTCTCGWPTSTRTQGCR